MKASLMLLEASYPRCVCFCSLYCLTVTQRKKQYAEIPLRYFIIILLVPASSIYMMHHIFHIAASHTEYSFFSVAAGILLLCQLRDFTVYDRIGQAAELQSRNRLYEQQLDLCSHQAEEREGTLSGTASDAA